MTGTEGVEPGSPLNMPMTAESPWSRKIPYELWSIHYSLMRRRIDRLQGDQGSDQGSSTFYTQRRQEYATGSSNS